MLAILQRFFCLAVWYLYGSHSLSKSNNLFQESLLEDRSQHWVPIWPGSMELNSGIERSLYGDYIFTTVHSWACRWFVAPRRQRRRSGRRTSEPSSISCVLAQKVKPIFRVTCATFLQGCWWWPLTTGSYLSGQSLSQTTMTRRSDETGKCLFTPSHSHSTKCLFLIP